jgi:hypothetical protein
VRYFAVTDTTGVLLWLLRAFHYGLPAAAAGRSIRQRNAVPTLDPSVGCGYRSGYYEYETGSDPEIAISWIEQTGLGCREHAGMCRNAVDTIEVGAFDICIWGADEEPHDDEDRTGRCAEHDCVARADHLSKPIRRLLL